MDKIDAIKAFTNFQNSKITNLEELKPIGKETQTMKEMPNIPLGRDLVKPVNIIKAGDKVLETAYDAQTKSGQATFTLAKGDEVFPNVWDANGGKYTPNKGDIILRYGEVPKDWGISNPDVLKEMEEKGLTTYPDRAVSSEVDIMYETYKGQDGRDFAKSPLKYGETVQAEKKIFPSKFLFAKPGTMVETLEAKNGTQSMAKVGNFQFVQLDTKGNPYVKDINDLIKRLEPVGEDSKTIFAKVKDVISQRKDILKSVQNKETQETLLNSLWLKELSRLIK